MPLPIAANHGRLRELLLQHSLLRGEFTLASGQRSNVYFDSKRTTLLPEGGYLAAAEVLGTLRHHAIRADAVGGPTLGADPIVCPVSVLSHIDGGRPLRAFLVRREAKDHGTGGRIEGLLEPRSRVVILDDVITTGGSTRLAIDAVEAAGHEVVAVVCLVDREQGGARALARWPFYPIFGRAELFDQPLDGKA
jgi:orotate phosphoribosyltransferase